MNRKQVLCAFVGIGFFLLAGLFPPSVHRFGAGTEIPGGFTFLFNPPQDYGLTLDIRRLIIEWVLIAVATGGLFILFGVRNSKPLQVAEKVRIAVSDSERKALYRNHLMLSIMPACVVISSLSLWWLADESAVIGFLGLFSLLSFGLAYLGIRDFLNSKRVFP